MTRASGFVRSTAALVEPPERDAPRADADTPRRPGAKTRSAAIADAIRLAVVEHRLSPGTKLSEDQLGAIFGASRTIVRAALQALAHDHIVSLAKNRGAHVASPTVEDARHLFEARRVLEEVIVRKAAAGMTPRHAATLRRLLEEGRRAVARDDRGAAIRLSGEFHLAIAGVAAQPILHGFLAEMISRTSLVIALYGRGRSADCGEVEHQGLLDAMTARDPDRAARLMRHHLDHIEGDLDLTRHRDETVGLSQVFGG